MGVKGSFGEQVDHRPETVRLEFFVLPEPTAENGKRLIVSGGGAEGKGPSQRNEQIEFQGRTLTFYAWE
jgi:hypothetical protein